MTMNNTATDVMPPVPPRHRYGSTVLRATYRARVTAQHRVEGEAIFRPEAIGQWGNEATAYFNSEKTMRENFAAWNKVNPWEYKCVGLDWVEENTLPGRTMVHTDYVHPDHGHYYLTLPKTYAA